MPFLPVPLNGGVPVTTSLSLNSTDPTRHWTREIGHLRLRAAKVRAAVANAPAGAVIEDALALCDTVVQDLAGAHLDAERLRGRLAKEIAAWQVLFDAIPMACVCTDLDGQVLNVNRPAALLLNYSVKHLIGRDLLIFTDDREKFTRFLGVAGAHSVRRTTVTLRPRERKPRVLEVTLRPASQDNEAAWLWFLGVSGPLPTSSPVEPQPSVPSPSGASFDAIGKEDCDRGRPDQSADDSAPRSPLG
jgi:PAS domain S-box-containing protein